ncbi:MAG TPA: malto-oligosyltrehalose synthase, partial [Verrucomicrobiae bacterium]|nr:malto-oligosyltrehalose synthase [Verrucomicrobiae bacterium]
AEYFDIDWNPPDPALKEKLLLPVLGDRYERVLEHGELKLNLEGDVPVLRYFEHRFPITPRSLESGEQLSTAKLSELNANRAALDALLQQQHYALAFWREGDSRLNYRRFFNIASLAGIRVENPRVFQDAHARVFDWSNRGYLDGIRIDHPDGLRDPLQYLQRLRAAAPKAWIVVEKILEPGEELPRDWPVAGTTGYDFLNRVAGLFIASASEKPLTKFYAEFTGEPTDFSTVVRKKKRRGLLKLLVAEVNNLMRRLEEIAARHGRSFTGENLREALVELLACFPVYRTYAQAGTVDPGPEPRISPDDFRHIEMAVSDAYREKPGLDPALFEFIGDLLRMKLRGQAESEFVMRFQQLTGPAMAKGVEDTTFYCFNRFVAFNEVGGDPGHFGLSVEQFHGNCRNFQKHWPNTMLGTSTHDTKRSEDVRARLWLLSEIPNEWISAVRRWSAMNEKHRRNGLPDRNAEYFLYQTLVGAWPLPLERALPYMEKASREAKQRTSWNEPNADYDAALKEYIAAILNDSNFTDDLQHFVAPLIEPGHINSLAQTLIKLTAPGVPDIYQGNELWDLSLVDPDNRRPVDFATRQNLLDAMKGLSAMQVRQRRDEGLPKLWLIQKTLEFRRRHPDMFGANASYEALFARGKRDEHVVALMRGESAIAIAPRLVARLENDWADTTLRLPVGGWHNELTGEDVVGGELALGDLLQQFPVALLSRVKSL